jgi:tetratricopeptide (TPR) repeat protein
MRSILSIALTLVSTLFIATSAHASTSSNVNTEAGRIAQAMQLYTSATQAEAQSEKQLQLLDQAESILLKVIKNNPESLDAHRKLMGVYLQQRDYPKAIQTVQNAITLSPDDPKLFVALAILYNHSGALEYANAILDQALEIDPNLAVAREFKTSIEQELAMRDLSMETANPQDPHKPQAIHKRLEE